MKDFIQVVMDYAKNEPNKIALVDGGGSVAYSYQQIDYLSGKVYGYLKKKGIGKEDFVAICLPRSAQPVIAMLGVWKAGAAFVMLEEHYAPERTDYIIKDCACKLILDNSVWTEIQNTPSLAGHESTDEHDAALAIYTSGSTGNPKGVLHEFGSIDFIDRSNRFEGVSNISHDEIEGMITPMTFIAGAGACIMALMAGCTLHIIPYSIVKNPPALEKYIYEQRITKMSLSPTLYRAFQNFSPYLKKIFMGGEPISGIYHDRISIISAYSMSECGALVAAFRIDKKYDRTPIGKPQFDLDYWIVDEQGNTVPDGEAGELCIRIPYVRGYINNPKLTEEVFKNKIYHTGDLVKRLPDGNLMILGRNNDMIKINGNRVEPGEVEAAVKKVLGIDWACAKGFTEGQSSFICLYYVADIEIDYEKTRKELLNYIPYYMIPSHFIHLDSIPKNANGKVDKKSLQPPKLDECQEAYAAPENDIQRKICEAFQKALDLERVGIHDDFYKLGGDSLGSMMVVAESGIKELGINEIFRGRTPEKIAELVGQNTGIGSEESEEVREEKMRKPHKLTAEQTVMIDHQLYAPKSNMYNLAGLIRFDKRMDAQKLAVAANQAVLSHPSLGTVFFFNEDGEIMQQYKPELFQKAEVACISEKELEELQPTLIQPFTIINSSLCRIRVFQTEKAVYLFLDIHHSVFDGTSFQILLRDIDACYKGNVPAKKDSYYETLQARENLEETSFYEEAKKYFEERYFTDEYQVAPHFDMKTANKVLGSFYQNMSLSSEGLDAIEKEMKISRNEFFVTATLLAIAQYNKTDAVKVTWIFNGRQTAEEMQSTGYLLRILPVAEKLQGGETISNLLMDVHTQVTKGLEYSCYSYATIYRSSMLDDETEIIYQRDLKGVFAIGGVDAENVDLERSKPAYENVLDIEIMNDGDDFDILLEYATCYYKEESMERFLGMFKKISQKLVNVLNDKTMTVSDVIGE